MLHPRSAKAILLLDQIGPWSLVVAVVVITLTFALGYWQLTIQFPGHGLVYPGQSPTPCGFWDAVYFSIVTETTLGAGDIQPQGASRVLLSIQVFVGLAMGGVIVAKLTSVKGRELRLLAYRATGDWIEVCRFTDGNILFAFATIYAADDTLRYDGENFDLEGNPLGFFRSELIDQDSAILRFSYSNRDSSTAHFSEGTAALRFIEDAHDKSSLARWIRYQGTAIDFARRQTVSYQGVRATADEMNAIHGSDDDARLAVIQKHVSRLASKPKRADDGDA